MGHFIYAVCLEHMFYGKLSINSTDQICFKSHIETNILIICVSVIINEMNNLKYDISFIQDLKDSEKKEKLRALWVWAVLSFSYCILNVSYP